MMAEKIWAKIVANLLAIMVAASLSAMGYVATQITMIKADFASFKLESLERHKNLEMQIRLNMEAIKALGGRIDKLNGALMSASSPLTLPTVTTLDEMYAVYKLAGP